MTKKRKRAPGGGRKPLHGDVASTQLSVRLPPDCLQIIDAHAEYAGASRNAALVHLIRQTPQWWLEFGGGETVTMSENDSSDDCWKYSHNAQRNLARKVGCKCLKKLK